MKLIKTKFITYISFSVFCFIFNMFMKKIDEVAIMIKTITKVMIWEDDPDI